MTAASTDDRNDPAGLVPPVYEDLRAIAAGYFRRQPAGFTLRPTELVHEACLQILQRDAADWTSPAHFRAVAARKIWQVLVDHVRHRNAAKRGGGSDGPRRAALDPAVLPVHDRAIDLIDLADALEALAGESRRLHEVVFLHRFAGLTQEEVAGQLGVSTSTVEKDYRYALAWLRTRLREER